MNIKKIEYGVLGVILANAPTLTDVTGTTVDELSGNINSITLTLPSAPNALKGGLWLTGNAGDFQRFEHKGFSDNGDGTYTFSLSKLTKVKTTILAATSAFVELKDLPIYEYGDFIESEDYDFIQVKAEKPEQEFPNIKGDAANYWKMSVMAAAVNRIAQDKGRDELCEVYNQIERVFVRDMTEADLGTYSGVQILGLLQQESEDGKWDNERQGLIAEMEIKYYYT